MPIAGLQPLGPGFVRTLIGAGEMHDGVLAPATMRASTALAVVVGGALVVAPAPRSAAASTVAPTVRQSSYVLVHPIASAAASATATVVVSGSDVTQPTISAVLATEYAPATLRASAGGAWLLSFLTDEPGDTAYEIATNAAFTGSTTSAYADTGTRLLSHAIVLPGLAAYTTYWVRPKSRDAALNVGTGAAVSFTTAWTPAASPSAARPTLWLDWNLDVLAARYAGAGLTAPTTNATVRAPLDWAATAIGVDQPTSTQRPVFEEFGMNGAPCAFHEVAGNDNFVTPGAVAAMDFTGDRWILIVFAFPAGYATTFRPILGRYDVTTNTRRWEIALNPAASGATGKIGVWADTKSATTHTLTTFAGFNDGRNHSLLLNRGGTNEDVWVDAAFHETFTSMANTAGTGVLRVFANSSGSAITGGRWNKIIAGPGKLTTDQVAHLMAYVS